MLPGIKDLEVYQGTDFIFPFTIKESGAVKNLTGYTAQMQIRDSDNEELFLELTTENSKLSITPADGLITITISDVETKALKNGVYDLFLINSSGEKFAYLTGNVIITPSITR